MTGKMLIVDDEVAVLFGMRDYFTGLGFEVDCATELEEAQALLVYEPYEIVISDLRMSGSHGAEGLEMIGSVQETRPRARVILLTAHATSELSAEARRRGVHAVMLKPSPLSEIAAVVGDLVGQGQA